MIDQALIFLKQRLNGHLNLGREPVQSQEDPVVFLDGDQMDTLSFKTGAVTALLVNTEMENTLRSADLYGRTSPNGGRQEVQPDIRLNLYVLFVSRYRQYEDALSSLSQIIQYFQHHRVFDQQSAPELNEDIKKLIVEMITLPFAEQNEVWSALRVSYQPSVLYKVKLIVYRTDPTPHRPKIDQKTIRVSQ